MIKLEVYCTKIETIITHHRTFIIDEKTHPELKGLTEDEMITYIKENAYEMSAFSTEDYDSLGDELEDSDVEKEKYVPQSTEFNVEVSHED